MKQIVKRSYRFSPPGMPLGVVVAISVALPAGVTGQPAGVTGQPAASPDGAASLGEVLEVAVRQQPALVKASIDVAIADAAVLQAAGVDDWVFDTTGSWLSVRSTGIDRTLGAPLRNELDVFSLSANLSRTFASGGTLVLSAEANRADQQVTIDLGGTSIENDPIVNYGAGVSASFTQPLLRGRGSAIARAENRKLAINRDATELGYRRDAINAVRQVIAAYWELAYARRDLEIRKNSLDLANQRLRNTKIAISAGSVAATEALAVEQIIAAREEEVLIAELTISNRSLELRRIAGLEIGPGNIDLATAAPLGVTPAQFEVDSLLARALAHNPDVAVLVRLRAGAEIDVMVSENGLLPELDAAVSFGPELSYNPAEGNPSLGDAVKDAATFNNYRLNASLTYRQALGRRAATGAQRSARHTLRRQSMDLAEAKALVASNLVLAVKQAQTAQTRVSLAQKAIELAEKNIEAEQSRFELGRATNFDVLERQDELKQAQLRKARAEVDFLGAVAAIDALTGDILTKYGIELGETGDAGGE